jgi:serine/threonine protein phosphatase 1
MSEFWTFLTEPVAGAPMPADRVLYAIGDPHGHARHLDALLRALRQRLEEHGTAGATVDLVLLGDYVDRGPDSLGVLRRCAGLADELGVPVHALRGNHDQFLIDFLEPPSDSAGAAFDELDLWMANGGDRTLAELGVTSEDLFRTRFPALRQLAAAVLGPDLRAWLGELAFTVALEGHLFVHAGLDPGLPLAAHGAMEFLWMREPFLSATAWRHPVRVVHGHTPRQLEVLPHRIGVDSGCFRTGVLSAVEIGPEGVRFLAVSDDPTLARYRRLPSGPGVRPLGEPVPLTR